MSIHHFILSLLVVLTATASAAQEIDYFEDFEGEYEEVDPGLGINVRVGLPINIPSIETSSVDTSAGAGIAIGAGYEIFDWLSADVDLTISGGHEYERVIPFFGKITDDLTYVSFAVGARAYPFEYFEMGLPDWLEPYAFVGIGGNGFHGDIVDESGFLARFVAGSDFQIFEQIGAYAEIGVDTTSIDGVNAVTRIAVGASYRF